MKRFRRSTFSWVAAIVTAAPAVAAGQSVVLYGIVDVGVAEARNGAPGGHRAISVGSGMLAVSRWGLRISEDLGDGARAFAQFDAGLNADTGTAKSYAGNLATATPSSPGGALFTGFNRRSYVGMEGRFGRVELGRDWAPIFYMAVESDAMKFGLFGNLQALAQLPGGPERFASVSNGIFYTSPEFKGVKARLAYSLGSEDAAGLPSAANRFAAAGLEFVQGPWVIGTTFQQLDMPDVAGTPAAFTGTVTKRQDAAIGGHYTFSHGTLTAGYFSVGTPYHGTDTWVGGTIDFGVSTVLAQVQRFRQRAAAGPDHIGTLMGVGYIYNLSRRSALYATYGQMNNSGSSTFLMVSGDTAVFPGAPGADMNAFGVGLRHVF